jgi:exodeoxyribonuclease VII large subunit
LTSSKQIKLSELNTIIADTIKNKFSALKFWVIADVTNHSYKADTKIHYFELVEKDPNSSNFIAKIAGKAWGNGSMHISDFEKNTGQRFTNNINVLVYTAVEYHPVYGISVSVLDIDTNFTLGLLQQQREATLYKLVQENPFISKHGDNYFTKNKQLVFKTVLQRIALISSINSAGSEDFKHSLINNSFGYKFIIDDYFAIVQGENNHKQFFNKLIEVYNSGIDYDAVVITRGGGAQIDFLLFDNYSIARAVAKFPIPIITGIGHQKNITIVDLMANTQTKTPTKAAEFIIAHNKSFEDKIISIQKNILIKSQQLFSKNYQRLSILNSNIVNNTRGIITVRKDELVNTNQAIINKTKSIIFSKKSNLINTSSQILTKPKIIVYNRINDIKNTFNNLKTFNNQYQKNKKSYLGHYVSIIKMMSPENILKKGYAVVKVNNKITSNPNNIKIGNDIEIILSDKIINSTVTSKSEYNGNEFNV